jgi:type VI secretion system secreted protein VgrG
MQTPATTQLTRSPIHFAHLESDVFPADRLAVRRVEGREGISELFSFDVVLVEKERFESGAPIDPDEMIGARVRIRLLDHEENLVRTVSGVVSSARLRLDDDLRDQRVYELRVVPRAHRLGLVTTQEIFMGMSVPEIIQAKFERIGLGDAISLRLAADYPKREFVVQYKETDLAFVSRLAEHLGVSFLFEQGDEHETIVFTDHQSGFLSFGRDEIEVRIHAHERSVFELAMSSRAVPSFYAVQDYNYRHPLLDIGGSCDLDQGTGGGVIEYGTHHKTPDEARALAAIRAEESLAGRRVFDGKSTVGGFTAGAHLRFDEMPFGKQRELLLTEVRHRFVHVRGEDGGAGHFQYENEFRAVPSDRTYRPRRATPRPRIDGVVSGVIEVGPDGEVGAEAKLDDQGRYTVQFHFDTAEPGAQRPSRPVRMAQPFAGPEQGMHFPLRPGTEVIIAFIDGDPDRPVIVGALPNPVTPSRVVAADAHMHRIRSRHGLVVEFGRATKS